MRGEILQRGDIMGFWIYMFVMALLMPVTLLLFGLYFRNKAPKNINIVFGYRTSRSMKNMDTWRFAHRFCGLIWIVGGCISLPAAIIPMLLVMGESVETIGYMGAACFVLPFIFIVVSIIFTENALKKKFDSFGHPKK